MSDEDIIDTETSMKLEEEGRKLICIDKSRGVEDSWPQSSVSLSIVFIETTELFD